MKFTLALCLLGCWTPALAQGVSNNRDVNGNIARDKGLASSNVQTQPRINGTANQAQNPGIINRARQQPTVVVKPIR